MNTNFQMLRELLEVYHPEQIGIASAQEVELINKKLHIKEMDILQLRNLRDFAVIFLGGMDTMEALDQMSAIASVIDHRIWDLGGEV